MTEETRGIKEILEELFKGQEAALYKYARVRKTQYEIGLWKKYGLPLREVGRSEKQYFVKRFLLKMNSSSPDSIIENTSPEELEKAWVKLDCAVKSGCHNRCVKLMEELMRAYKAKGLCSELEIEKFLDWLTFSYEVRKDHNGRPVEEKPYGFEIRIFNSDDNRKEFWSETKSLLEQGKVMSIQNIAKIVLFKRHQSVHI